MIAAGARRVTFHALAGGKGPMNEGQHPVGLLEHRLPVASPSPRTSGRCSSRSRSSGSIPLARVYGHHGRGRRENAHWLVGQGVEKVLDPGEPGHRKGSMVSVTTVVVPPAMALERN